MPERTATYESNTTWPEVAARIADAERIALCTHRKPDGDALGSVLALGRAFEQRGQAYEIIIMGPLEPGLQLLVGATPYYDAEDGPPTGDFDLVVIVDTGAWSQLEPIEPWLRERRDDIVVIDHHVRGDDDLSSARIVDPSCAAAVQLVARLLDELDVTIDGGPWSIGEALYLGLATDTGWFRYANTSPAVFRLAARLFDAGVDGTRVFGAVEEGHRPQRLALQARALTSVRYVADGRVVLQTLAHADFTETGGAAIDLEGIVNIPMAVRDVRVSVLLTEADPGVTKLSFRAKPAAGGGPALNVSKLAEQFGGGGHPFAAGGRIKAAATEARERVSAALSAADIR